MQVVVDAPNIKKQGIEYFVDHMNPKVKKSIEEIKNYYNNKK
jgi:hypothetical protein